jgi:cell division septation protein DedD
VGAVDRGLAGIWAEGLRTHGLDAFVAPGPTDKMWRVVIGPLPNPDAYQRAKTKLDELGINTFGRKQQ